jgi:hypothetical protein
MLVDPVDARGGRRRRASRATVADGDHDQEDDMYVVVLHRILDPETAFQRGRALMEGEGAPPGVRVLQFYPSRDASLVTCLVEAGAVADVQGYVDRTLGDASENTTYAVDERQAFAERPLGLPDRPAVPA